LHFCMFSISYRFFLYRLHWDSSVHSEFCCKYWRMCDANAQHRWRWRRYCKLSKLIVSSFAYRILHLFAIHMVYIFIHLLCAATSPCCQRGTYGHRQDFAWGWRMP
jgi:hypothetical protein